MKYKTKIKANIDEYFAMFEDNLLMEYEQAKGVQLDPSKLQKGFTFQKEISSNADKKAKRVRMGTVKLLQFDRPNGYRLEFTTDRYHKITGLYLIQVGKNELDVIYEEIEDYLKKNSEGKDEWVPSIVESDEIRPMPLMKKFKFKQTAKDLKYRQKAKQKNKKQ